MTSMADLPDVVSREEWLAARKELLAREKEVTRARDRVNAERRRLPMVRVEADSDFNYDFHATVDERVAPVQIYHRTEAELAEAGQPWTERMRGDYPGISAFLRVGDEVFHTYSTFGRGIEEFHNGYPYLDLTALRRQEAWEEPKGRAQPLVLQVGGPAMRLPDEYDV